MISYTVSTNIITVTGYSEATPCNFTDLYNADKAGTLSLHARTGITVADGAAVAVDRAERPADYVVLGGASNDLYITIANWNGTTATIRITGTDRDGAAQTEDIVVNANGQYNTTKWFKTITHTQVTGATVTSFDYDLTQGQWGVVSLQQAKQFYFTSKLRIGDGSNVSYFADIEKQINFADNICSGGVEVLIEVMKYGSFKLGVVYDESSKSTGQGCFVFSLESSTYPYLIQSQGTDRNVEIYSSAFGSYHVGKPAPLKIYNTDANISKVWNCLFQTEALVAGTKNVDVFNITVSDSMYGYDRWYTGMTIDKVNIFHCNYAARVQGGTIKNLYARDVTKGLNYLGSDDAYLINPDLSSWVIVWGYNPNNSKIYRQYNFDLKVIDQYENDVNGAIVKIWDKDDILVVDTTTASGVIAEQTLNYGYYNQAGGSTPVMQTPHTLEIRKAGYKTYKKKFTRDSKTDWTIALQRIAINIDMEVIA